MFPEIVVRLREAFDREHERADGYCSKDEIVELINIRVIATGLSEASRVPAQLGLPDGRRITAESAQRDTYFGRDLGWLETPVVGRQEIGQGETEGPAIIEEYDCTTVVPPGWRVRRDDRDVLVMTAE